MKIQTFVGIISVLVILSSGCSKDKVEKENTTRLETGDTNDEVINVAKARLPYIKSSILADNVSHFGFNSPAELDQIQIGTPFLYLDFTPDFRNDSIYDTFNKYINNGRQWKVPLCVGNDIRCFMTVAYFQGSLKAVEWGSSNLANYINDCVKEYNLPSENRYIIEDHVYAVMFVMVKAGDDLTIYPVHQSMPIQEWFPSHCKSLDKVYYGFRDLFNEFKKERSCFN